MSPPETSRSVLPALLVAVLALGIPACGGGGGGGGGSPPPPTQPTAGITFTPSGGAANGIALARQGAGTTTLVVEVRANTVDPIFGVSFDLSYPSNLLRFDSAQEGGFLSNGGTASTSLLVEENPTGNLIVGNSRLGSSGSIGGSGVLVTLSFTAIAGGSGNFTFSRNGAFDNSGNEQSQISWGSAAVEVRL